MEVFMLNVKWDYEGYEVIGVYSSREKAEAAYEEYNNSERRHHDDWFIMKKVLDAKAALWLDE